MLNIQTSFAKTINFNHEIFFTLILPPIIFGAGYNLRRKFFFKYIFYILLFGVIGTVINFCLVAPFTLLVNNSVGFTITSKVDIFDKDGKVIQALVDENELGESSHHKRLLDEVETIENKVIDTLADKSEYNDVKEVYDVVKNEYFDNNENNHNNTEHYNLVNNNNNGENSTHINPINDIHTTNDDHHSNEIPKNYELHNETVVFFSSKEILLFASVISATDAVAALAFIKEESDPKLFPILFGEGVVNDAVCIVLYQIIKRFLDSGACKCF